MNPSSGRNPFEIALMIVCFATGVTGLVLPESPSPSLLVTFGPWAVMVYLGFLLSSGAAIVGIFLPRVTMRRLQIGLLVERAAMVPLAGMAGAYAVSAYDQSGARAIVAVMLIGGIALACLARARQIRVDLRALSKALPPER